MFFFEFFDALFQLSVFNLYVKHFIAQEPQTVINLDEAFLSGFLKPFDSLVKPFNFLVKLFNFLVKPFNDFSSLADFLA